MLRLTASDIVKAIARLPKTQHYNYIEDRTTTKIIIEEVKQPEGPIFIKRYDPNKGQNQNLAKRVSISVQMIWRYANAFSPNLPINVDRVLGASYNTRSALEVLLAHTLSFIIATLAESSWLLLQRKSKQGINI